MAMLVEKLKSQRRRQMLKWTCGLAMSFLATTHAECFEEYIRFELTLQTLYVANETSWELLGSLGFHDGVAIGTLVPNSEYWYELCLPVEDCYQFVFVGMGNVEVKLDDEIVNAQDWFGAWCPTASPSPESLQIGIPSVSSLSPTIISPTLTRTTISPTLTPTLNPTVSPSLTPTSISPTTFPSFNPTTSPSTSPSLNQTIFKLVPITLGPNPSLAPTNRVETIHGPPREHSESPISSLSPSESPSEATAGPLSSLIPTSDTEWNSLQTRQVELPMFTVRLESKNDLDVVASISKALGEVMDAALANFLYVEISRRRSLVVVESLTLTGWVYLGPEGDVPRDEELKRLIKIALDYSEGLDSVSVAFMSGQGNGTVSEARGFNWSIVSLIFGVAALALAVVLGGWIVWSKYLKKTPRLSKEGLNLPEVSSPELNLAVDFEPTLKDLSDDLSCTNSYAFSLTDCYNLDVSKNDSLDICDPFEQDSIPGAKGVEF